MMKIQIIIIVLFILNLASLWSTAWLKKCSWYRSVGIIIAMLMPLLLVFPDQPRFELDFFWWKFAGVIAIVLGVGLLLWTGLEIRKQKVSLGNCAVSLKTSGPYAIVRHPYYLSLIFVWVGWWWVWSAVYAFYFGMFVLLLLWLEAYLEERLLLVKQFGVEFLRYRNQTGMFWIK